MAAGLTTAHAQDAGPAQGNPASEASLESGNLEQVVVTGSRIDRGGFTAPTPVTVLGSEDIAKQAPSSVADVLTQLPSFRATNNPQTAGVTSVGGGRYLLNLRGLGPSRTLVMLDGHRYVPTSADGQVDFNQFPTLLVSRAEVVTGGASAAWGSDAVAGVVNVLLNDDLRGLKGEVQTGRSERGDGEQTRVSLAAGTDFADGRGSFIVGGDYVELEGVGDQYTRDWGRREYGLITNPDFATNGLPNFIISPNVRNSRLYTGSVVVSGPLRGTAFAPDGTPFQFEYGQVFGNEMIGGTGYGESRPVGSNLSGPVTRANVLARGGYDVSDSLRVFAEASYAWSEVGGQSGQPRDVGTLTIQRDNAYLPQSVRQQMIDLNLQTLQIGRQSRDFGHNQIDNETETMRVLIGARGDLGGSWTWDTYAQLGDNRYNSVLYPNRLNVNWPRSIDAVVDPATGDIVCRSTLTDPGNGCIPSNIFGHGQVRPNAYTAGESWYLATNDQQVYALNFQGELFSTWAGPVSVATGGEYRRESADAKSDPLQQVANANGTVGAYNQANQQPFVGKYDVYEFYGETAVPLARDLSWAHEADINAAVRRTTYSTSGPVTTWKIGGNYAPTADLRFRATRSRDIRAPNISELFGPREQGGITNLPNRQGVSQQVLRYGGGNPNLDPEIADTFTAGLVYQPSWLSGLRLSADYYEINIEDVISSVGHAEVARQCFSGITAMCDFVEEDANGNIILVQSALLNLNELQTSGVDFEVAYNFGLGSMVPGNFGLRLVATYVDELVTVDASGRTDRVGQLSNNGDASGVPHWSWVANLSYDYEPFSVNLRGRYIGEGVFNTRYHEGAGDLNSINDNSVPSRFYLDASLQYGWTLGSGTDVEIFGRVANLLDQDPPMVPSGGLGGTNATSTNGAFYDTIGRAYTAGFRVSF